MLEQTVLIMPGRVVNMQWYSYINIIIATDVIALEFLSARFEH